VVLLRQCRYLELSDRFPKCIAFQVNVHDLGFTPKRHYNGEHARLHSLHARIRGGSLGQHVLLEKMKPVRPRQRGREVGTHPFLEIHFLSVFGLEKHLKPARNESLSSRTHTQRSRSGSARQRGGSNASNVLATLVLGTGRAMQGRCGGACTTGLGTGPDAEHERRGVWDMCKPNPKPETMTIGLAQEVPIRAGATGAAGWDRYKRTGQLAGSQWELNLSPGILRQLSQPMPSPPALLLWMKASIMALRPRLQKYLSNAVTISSMRFGTSSGSLTSACRLEATASHGRGVYRIGFGSASS
jgi:hypothetical protein